MEEINKNKRDLEEIFLRFFGIEINHFYLSDNGKGRIILKTSKKYLKRNNGNLHPWQEVGREIVAHYYRFGKESVFEMISRGEFKKG